MSDFELLENAAKAINLSWFDLPAALAGRGLHLDSGKFWNPLVDDGDALRLATALGIDIEWHEDDSVDAYQHATANGLCFTASESGADRVANVRRAIVRVAAEVGRRVPFILPEET